MNGVSEPDRSLPELPFYLDDPVDDGASQAVAPVRVRDTVVQVGHLAGHAADAMAAWLAEASKAPYVYAPSSPAPPADSLAQAAAARHNVLVVHRVVGPPAALLADVDAWFARSRRTKVVSGAFRWSGEAGSGTAPQPGGGSRPAEQLRRLDGRFRARWWPVAVALELDVQAWSTIGLVLTLRPLRRGKARLRRFRRRAWFAGGHDLLDRLRASLGAAIA